MPPSGRAGLLLSLLVLVSVGCRPSCKQVCSKLLECDEVESHRVSLAECRNACVQEESLYEAWEDTQLLDDWYEQLHCIMDTSCEEIAEGVCYDEDLFRFSP